jgi:hypothetical protein
MTLKVLLKEFKRSAFKLFARFVHFSLASGRSMLTAFGLTQTSYAAIKQGFMGRLIVVVILALCGGLAMAGEPPLGGVNERAALATETPFRIDTFGRWSYATALTPYYILLAVLAYRYRVILRFATWKFFFFASALLFMLLGLVFEWIADILFVWTFPPGRDLFMIKVPIFGWFTGHEIPVCEFLWILGVVPLFYYLYLWATLGFYDIIYVVDENGDTYKKEERWVGFREPTRILTRKKGAKGREHERELLRRSPGILSRTTKRIMDDRIT